MSPTKRPCHCSKFGSFDRIIITPPQAGKGFGGELVEKDKVIQSAARRRCGPLDLLALLAFSNSVTAAPTSQLLSYEATT